MNTKNKLRDCPDCGVQPGKVHLDCCDVERCSFCGHQRLGCDCKNHDRKFARWTGVWPGEAEAAILGLFCKWIKGKGWVKCKKNDPKARPDLNAFESKGYEKYFFIKP